MTASKLIWEEDLEKSSEKYHIYGAWIAIIFDPVFGITDYFNIPHAFNQIMSLRSAVSIIAALALLATTLALKARFPCLSTASTVRVRASA